MADNNPLRGAYLTCANEIRRLVVRSSVEYHQHNNCSIIYNNEIRRLI